MIEKSGLIVLICLLLSSIISANVLSTPPEEVSHQIVISTNLAALERIKIENNVLINIQGQTSYLMDPGKPMVPIISKTLIIPIGSTIESCTVNITTNPVRLEQKLLPAPKHHILNTMVSKMIYKQDLDVYTLDEFYPIQQFRVRKGIGLENHQHVMFVTIDCFSQYNPISNIIKIPSEITIEYSYNPPTKPLFTADEYDLLIITDEQFVNALTPLVQHKSEHHVRTIMETVQEILPLYEGRDAAEDIKLRIRDAVEEWGIDYVLLAGGRIGQSYDWYVPSRRSNNRGSGWESGYECDLYFADIYKIVDDDIFFEDWDTNGNGVFAEFSGFGNEDSPIDYHPDVSIGRLPIRYEFEATNIVNKIINYETNADDSWFKRAVMIAGDTTPPARGGSLDIYEGELETSLASSFLEQAGYIIEKLWTSTQALTSSTDVIRKLSHGEGLVFMTGHGNPASLGTYLPNAESEAEFPNILTVFEMSLLTNNEKLPIVLVGGCHNAQFNVTIRNMVHDILKYGIGGYFFTDPFRLFYMEWVPRCFCEWLVTQKSSGAIGSIGCSGLGLGYANDAWNYGLSGWLDPKFFECVADLNTSQVGQAHINAINDYINVIGEVNNDYADRKTIEQWTLLADPSLLLGGYN